MRLPASDIAGATGGTCVGPDVDVDGAAIDSRTIKAGQLFVPIVAERDGHEFVAAAVANGAPAYLTERGPIDADATAIEVDDTAAALLAAGGLARERLDGPVVGITGSVGKTTVKDLTAAAVAGLGPVAASERSFNNELGVPTTLLNAPDGAAVAVVEMGARGAGHIALLCGVAKPTVAVVTVVALAHTELFGSLEAVAEAKGELVESLPENGTAVLNKDQPAVAAMASRTTARILTFGDHADLTAEDVVLDDDLRPSFRLHTPWGDQDLRLAVHGAHQVANALAAAGAALACGADLTDVAERLATARTSPWRMHLARTGTGARVLNDAYNANPTSMEAALRALAALPAVRRVAVLGVMAELGSYADAEHERIGKLARALDIRVVAVGTSAYGGEVAPDADAALEAVGPLGPDDALLVKGSRVRGSRGRRRTAGCVTRATAWEARCSAGCGGSGWPC